MVLSQCISTNASSTCPSSCLGTKESADIWFLTLVVDVDEGSATSEYELAISRQPRTLVPSEVRTGNLPLSATTSFLFDVPLTSWKNATHCAAVSPELILDPVGTVPQPPALPPPTYPPAQPPAPFVLQPESPPPPMLPPSLPPQQPPPALPPPLAPQLSPPSAPPPILPPPLQPSPSTPPPSQPPPSTPPPAPPLQRPPVLPPPTAPPPNLSPVSPPNSPPNSPPISPPHSPPVLPPPFSPPANSTTSDTTQPLPPPNLPPVQPPALPPPSQPPSFPVLDFPQPSPAFPPQPQAPRPPPPFAPPPLSPLPPSPLPRFPLPVPTSLRVTLHLPDLHGLSDTAFELHLSQEAECEATFSPSIPCAAAARHTRLLVRATVATNNSLSATIPACLLQPRRYRISLVPRCTIARSCGHLRRQVTPFSVTALLKSAEVAADSASAVAYATTPLSPNERAAVFFVDASAEDDPMLTLTVRAENTAQPNGGYNIESSQAGADSAGEGSLIDSRPAVDIYVRRGGCASAAEHDYALLEPLVLGSSGGRDGVQIPQTVGTSTVSGTSTRRSLNSDEDDSSDLYGLTDSRAITLEEKNSGLGRVWFITVVRRHAFSSTEAFDGLNNDGVDLQNDASADVTSNSFVNGLLIRLTADVQPTSLVHGSVRSGFAQRGQAHEFKLPRALATGRREGSAFPAVMHVLLRAYAPNGALYSLPQDAFDLAVERAGARGNSSALVELPLSDQALCGASFVKTNDLGSPDSRLDGDAQSVCYALSLASCAVDEAVISADDSVLSLQASHFISANASVSFALSIVFEEFVLRDAADSVDTTIYMLAGSEMQILLNATEPVSFELKSEITDLALSGVPPSSDASNPREQLLSVSMRDDLGSCSMPLDDTLDGEMSETALALTSEPGNGSTLFALRLSPCQIRQASAEVDQERSPRDVRYERALRGLAAWPPRALVVRNAFAPRGGVLAVRLASRFVLAVLPQRSFVTVGLSAAFPQLFLLPNFEGDAEVEVFAEQLEGPGGGDGSGDGGGDGGDGGLVCGSVDCPLLLRLSRGGCDDTSAMLNGISSVGAQTLANGVQVIDCGARYDGDPNRTDLARRAAAEIDARCDPDAISTDATLSEADVWAPRAFDEASAPNDASGSAGNGSGTRAARQFVYARDASRHGATLCALGESGWQLLVTPQPWVSPRRPVQTEIRLRLWARVEPMVELLSGSVFERSASSGCVEIRPRLPTGELLQGRSPLHPTEPRLQQVRVAYGAMRHFAIDVNDDQSRLIVQLLHLERSRTNDEHEDQCFPSPPRPVRLLLSYGQCPSLTSYAHAALSPRYAQPAVCSSASATASSPATSSCPSIPLSRLPSLEWYQQVQLGDQPNELQRGRYYVTVIGGPEIGTPSPSSQIQSDENRSAFEIAAAVICQPGRTRAASQFSNFSARCDPCATGSVKGAAEWGELSCRSCPAGEFAPSLGAQSCEQCPAGTRNPVRGASSCAPCAAGTYRAPRAPGDVSAATSCTQCSPFSYMPIDGATACFACPNNTLTQTLGATSLAQCACRRGFFTPLATSGVPCFACPQGAVCEGGAAQPYPAEGFIQLQSRRFKQIFPQCSPPEVCLRGGYCANGYIGELCAECAEGYYRYGQRCRECSSLHISSGREMGLLVLGVTVLFCLGMYMLAAPSVAEQTTAVFLLITFVQTLDLFSLLSMLWPLEWDVFFSALSIFNFNLQLAGLECYYRAPGSFVETLVLQLTLPIFALALYASLVFTYGGALVFTRLLHRTHDSFASALASLARSHRFLAAAERSLGAFIATLDAMYTMLALKTFSLFHCRDLDEGVQVLYIYPALQCWSSDHLSLLPLACISMLVYVIGIPVLFYTLLKLAAKSKALRDGSAGLRLGSLYLRYDQTYWWFELLVLFRKFMAVAVVAFATKYTLLQSALLLLVLFAAIVVQDYARPYLRPIVNLLDFVLLLAAHLVLLLAIIYNSAFQESTQYTACDDENITAANITCQLNEYERNAAALTMDIATWCIFGVLLVAFFGSSLVIYYQIQQLLYRIALEGDERAFELDAKLTKLRALYERVLAPKWHWTAGEWLRISNDSERDYFKHLLSQLDQHYQDWLDRQAKDAREFLEQSWEKILENVSFLYNVGRAFMKIICCLRRKNTVVKEQRYTAPVRAPPPGAAPPKQPLVARLKAALFPPEQRRGRVSVARKRPSLKNRESAESVGAVRRNASSQEALSDDLVEAYVRSMRAIMAPGDQLDT